MFWLRHFIFPWSCSASDFCWCWSNFVSVKEYFCVVVYFTVLTLSSLQTNTDISFQTVQMQMRQLVMSHHIRIHTVCHSVIYFWLKPLFPTMDTSNIQRWKSPTRKLRVERANVVFAPTRRSFEHICGVQVQISLNVMSYSLARIETLVSFVEFKSTLIRLYTIFILI